MPELMIDFITSLDGYGAAEGWPGWWGLEGPEYLTWLGDQPEAGYTILMGANTYRLMHGFAASGEPGTEELAGMPKIVVSSTLNSTYPFPEAMVCVETAPASGQPSHPDVFFRLFPVAVTFTRDVHNTGSVVGVPPPAGTIRIASRLKYSRSEWTRRMCGPALSAMPALPTN